MLKGKHGKKSSGRKYAVDFQGFWSPAAPWQPFLGLVENCTYRVSGGVWPLFPVFAPAVPKPSSPLEGILEVCRKLTAVGFYFGMRLQTSLPACRALAGCERVPRGSPASCGDSAVALPSSQDSLRPPCLLVASSVLGCEKKPCGEPEQPGLLCDSPCGFGVGWSRALAVGAESVQGAGCPIPAQPAPADWPCFEQIPPRPTERFLFVRKNVH